MYNKSVVRRIALNADHLRMLGIADNNDVLIVGGGTSGGTAGQPARSTLFYPIYMWAQAFEWMRMGYACAIGLLMLLFLLCFTLTLNRYFLTEKYQPARETV